MFCDFDLFKKGKAIYEIDRVVRGTKLISNNGVREIYVNTTAKTTDKRLKSLFKIMSTVNEVDDKMFPKLSKKKLEVNDLYIGGDKNMAGLDLMMYKDGIKDGREKGREEGIRKGIKRGREEGREEGKINLMVEMVRKGLIDTEIASKGLGISEEEVLKLVN